MKLKYIVAAIAAIGGLTVNPAIAVVHTQTVDLAKQALHDGDVVETDYNTGIAAEIGDNHILALGQGSITVNVTPVSVTGYITGIKLSDRQTHDLGLGTSISIKSEGNNHIIRAIGLGNSSHVAAQKMNIDIDASKSDATAVYSSGNSNVDLGSGSTITIEAATATGVYAALDSTFTADQATITLNNSNDGILTGILAEKGSQIDLGSHSVISVNGNHVENTGIRIDGGNVVVKANVLTIESSGTAIAVNKGSANIDLGSNSVLTGTNNHAIDLRTRADEGLTTLTASGLGVTTSGKNAYGIFAVDGLYQIDLGVGSEIKTSGDFADGIVMAGADESTLKADGLNIEVSGDGAAGVRALGGTVNVNNSQIKAAQSSGIGADSNNGNKVEVTVANSIIESEVNGAHARFENAQVNIENSSIKVTGQGEKIVGLWSMKGATINLTDSQLDVAAEGAYGIHADSGGQVNVNGYNKITTKGLALFAEGADTLINAKGRFEVQGDVVADDQGIIAIQSEAGTYVKGGLVQTNNGLIDFKGQETTWDMTKNSSLNSLALNQGQINFIGNEVNQAFNTLEVAKLSGSSSFNMRAGIATGEGDLLKVTESSDGQHQVAVANQGSANANGKEVVTLIKTPDGKATFNLTNKVELGGYVYGLKKDENQRDWSLVAPNIEPGPSITTTADAAANSLVVNYLANFIENQSLAKRMGELRTGSGENDVWGRVYGGKIDSFGSGLLSGFDMDYKGIQLGVDHQLAVDNGNRFYMGAALGLLDTDQDYKLLASDKRHQKGSGSLKSYSAAIYGTYVTDRSAYADVMVKYARMKNRFDVLDTADNKVEGSAYSTGLSLSAEVGKRFNMDTPKGQWHVTPQAQLTLSTVEGTKFKPSNDLTVSVDDRDSVLGRVGTEMGYDFKNLSNPTTVYLKASYLKEFSGSARYALNSSKESHSFKGHWWQYGIGLNTQINKQHNVYLDLESNQGNDFDQRQINAGYRFTF